MPGISGIGRGELWLPYSAAALVMGGIALVLGALAMPGPPVAEELYRTIRAGQGGWLVAACAFYAASVGLTLGIPAVLTLILGRPGSVLGAIGSVFFGVGAVGITGVATLMLFLRGLVVQGVLSREELFEVATDVGLSVYLLVVLVALFLGEVTLGGALWAAHTVPHWVAVVLITNPLLVGLAWVSVSVAIDVLAITAAVTLIVLAVRANDAGLRV